MQYSLNIIILVQGFCPLKINITQFPGGFRLNILGPKYFFTGQFNGGSIIVVTDKVNHNDLQQCSHSYPGLSLRFQVAG